MFCALIVDIRLFERFIPRVTQGMDTLSFILTPLETDRVSNFISNHMHRDMGHTAIGGHISYLITPTSLGCAYTVTCSRCGVSEDVTEYEAW